MRAKLVNEGYGQKDIVRMESLRDKSNGDPDKEMQYALNMAKSIKNAGKAQARGEGAEEVFGDTRIADVFYARSLELAGHSVEAEPSQMPGTKRQTDYSQYKKPYSKLGFEEDMNPYAALGIGSFSAGAQNAPTPQREKKHHGGGRWGRGVSILTMATVNLQNGNSKYFNVMSEWKGDSVAEIWQTDAGKYKVMFTSGKKPLHQIGDTASFMADQSGRYLFEGTMIDWTHIDDLPGLVPYYGKSIGGYVYK